MFSFAFPSRLAMNTRSRLLAWLPAFLLGPVLALCSTLALAEAPAEASKALHLLDYIGADYPPTVQDGKVIDQSPSSGTKVADGSTVVITVGKYEPDSGGGGTDSGGIGVG